MFTAPKGYMSFKIYIAHLWKLPDRWRLVTTEILAFSPPNTKKQQKLPPTQGPSDN